MDVCHWLVVTAQVVHFPQSQHFFFLSINKINIYILKLILIIPSGIQQIHYAWCWIYVDSESMCCKNSWAKILGRETEKEGENRGF